MANWTRDDSRTRNDQVLEDLGILDSIYNGDDIEYRDFNYDPQRSSNTTRGVLASCCVLSLALLPLYFAQSVNQILAKYTIRRAVKK